MAFIHEHPQWPRFFWDPAALADTLAAVRHRQGRLLGRMASIGLDLQAEADLAVLARDAITTSAIEGETLDPNEVRSSLARRLGIEAGGLPTPSREVDGIVEVLLDATRRFDAPLTADRLFAWHAALFPTGRSGLRQIDVATWRTAGSDPMQVVSGAYGRERIHFEAPQAARVEAEMSAFLDWFNAPLTSDPLLQAGLAHFWFVTIHPFADGNGRLARAIADLALARADGSSNRCYSMSSQIEREQADYYRRLEWSQRGGLDVTQWLDWFLGCLDRAIDASHETLETVLRKARLWRRVERHPIQDRQRRVLERLMDRFEGHLTTSKYATLAKCSPDTALRDVRQLVSWGVLERNAGGGRSTSYRLADPPEGG